MIEPIDPTGQPQSSTVPPGDTPDSLRRAAYNLLNATSPGRDRIRDVHDRMMRAADAMDGLSRENERLRGMCLEYSKAESEIR